MTRRRLGVWTLGWAVLSAACGDDGADGTGAGATGETVAATTAPSTSQATGGGEGGGEAETTSTLASGGAGGAGGDGGDGGDGGATSSSSTGGLAGEEISPRAMAVFDGHLYWLDASAACTPDGARVMRRPIGSDAGEVLAADDQGYWDFRDLAVDATGVYWSGARRLLTLPLAGGTPTTIVTFDQEDDVGQLAVDGISTYWVKIKKINDVEGRKASVLKKTPHDGGPTVTLATGLDVTDLVVDDTSVYWTNRFDGTVMKVSVDGGVPVEVAAAQSHPGKIAVAGTKLTWSVDGQLVQSSLDGLGRAPLVVGWGADHLVVDGAAATWSAGTSILTVALDGGTPRLLAESEKAPSGLAVGGGEAHWGQPSGSPSGSPRGNPCSPTFPIQSVSVASGEPAEPPAPVDPQVAYPEAMVVGDGSVFWGDSSRGTVMMEPSGGGDAVTLASGQDPRSIAVGATDVYWTNPATGTVMKVAIEGGDPVVVASAQTEPVAVVVNATHVAWLNAREVMAATLDGGPPIELDVLTDYHAYWCGPNPPALRATSTHLYWIARKAYERCAPKVMTVSLAGGAPTPVAGGQVHPEWVYTPVSPMIFAVDETHAYWWNGTDQMMKVALTGTDPVPIAPAMSISAITVDATSVYWAGAGGSLMKAPLGGGDATLVASLEDGDVSTSIAVDDTSAYWMRPGVETATVVRAAK